MSSRAVADKHGIKTFRAKNHGLGQNVFNHKCETHRTKVNIPSFVTFWFKKKPTTTRKQERKEQEISRILTIIWPSVSHCVEFLSRSYHFLFVSTP